MESKTALLLKKAIDYNKGDARRISHLVKVYAFSELIGISEGINCKTLDILNAAAILHDIGIHECERKYNNTSGKYQEVEGPPVAEKILSELDYSDFEKERICWLIAHHHTYSSIDSLDYQILVEADFLVNIFEDNMSVKQIEKIKSKIFKTKSGIDLLDTMYLNN